MKVLLSCMFVLAAGWSLAWNGGYLGVNIADFEYQNDDHQKNQNGVLVTGIVSGSAADKAGLKRHDIINSINGETIHHPAELISYLNNLNPGETVHLKITRDDKPVDMDVALGERTFNRDDDNAKKWVFMSPYPKAWLGVDYFELTPELAEFFNVKGGMFIKKVIEDSPAQEAGLRAGDIILSVGGNSVETKKDFSRNMAKREEGDNVAFEINRKGQVLDFSVTLAKRNDFNMPNFKFEMAPGNEFFNLDADSFSDLYDIPDELHKLKPMVEMFEFQDVEKLQKQLEELKQELERLKGERKDN